MPSAANAEQLAMRCARDAISFAFTSSDLVFDGTRPPYHEPDAVNPVSVYGRYKTVSAYREGRP